MSKLVKHQSKSFSKAIDYEGKPATIVTRLRYDDECGNGHNSFSITGDIYRLGKSHNPEVCGCIHDEIAEHFPEFKHLIKWHLTASDGPMHYLANTTYHAGNRDCWGKLKGEPKQFETKIHFNDVPIPVKGYPESFVKFLQTTKVSELEIIEIAHVDQPNENYKFDPHYTFKGYNDGVWYRCPFSDSQEAEQFLKALQTCKIEYKTEAIAWGEGKERDLNAARSSAVWPEATDAELCSDNLRDLLIARLPKLMSEFRRDMEAIGFEY